MMSDQYEPDKEDRCDWHDLNMDGDRLTRCTNARQRLVRHRWLCWRHAMIELRDYPEGTGEGEH